VGENQTREEDLAKADPWTEGTGIFGVPDPETREVDRIRKVLVQNITYPHSVKLGRDCVAFKWVPRILTDVKCESQGHLCVKTCAHDVCLCVNGTCQ
jgi:hypothetical protein